LSSTIERSGDLLSRWLMREGYRDGGERAAALALTAAEDFDLVLLDLMMPGMSRL
jgi:DNA-binding response OmpR family regulator